MPGPREAAPPTLAPAASAALPTAEGTAAATHVLAPLPVSGFGAANILPVVATQPLVATSATADSFLARIPGRSSRSLGIAALTAALLAVGAYVVFTGGQAHTVSGDLSLTDGSLFSDLSNGASCEGSGGYKDIQAGDEVIIEDEAGKTLSTGQLGPGAYDGASCVFEFKFTGVPKAGFYRIHQSGDRGVLQYSYDDMVKSNWVVHVTLGS
jgi:hypothetical protein